MTEKRDIKRDRERTLQVIGGNEPREETEGENWLGHRIADDTVVLDSLLLDGATEEELWRAIKTEEAKKKRRIDRHKYHLRTEHGLHVLRDENGVYRIDRDRLQVDVKVSTGKLNNLGTVTTIPLAQAEAAERRRIVVDRIVRDTAASLSVKAAHDYRCQVCGTRLEIQSGYYAEGAHIWPLGKPYDGPDVAGNILCLCPNHHVCFDGGAFSVDQDLTLLGLEGRLREASGHSIDRDCLAHHRERFGLKPL